MAKYEHKVELTPRDRAEGQPPVIEPSLADVADAIQSGVEAVFGADFEVRVYDGNRPDRD